ncbi:MAG: zf-HC2 domain-containing protein, partial [Planctomycetes bacterium]|nr:zf-HC2 domain-containing protein [Planctomycetota bacterium]
MEHGCEDIQRLIAERSERALLPGEDAAVSRHLADCPACREFLRSHDELLHLFVAEFSRVPAALLSSSLAERVMARLPVRPGLPARQAEPELQPVAWRPRGRLRRLFGAPALAAAAVLVCAVLGWLFLGGTPEARLERWDPAVAWRVSAAADWRVADRPVALGIGRALYVPPGSHAQLRLGDGGTVLISDDAAFEPLAAGPHLGWGHALVRPADSAPVALDTPLGRVEMDEGGEFFLELSRPDACLDARRVVAAPAATTDLVVWSLRGTARVRTGERETRVATGESRAFVPGGPPCALSAYEIRRLARQLEAAGQAPGRSSLRLAPSAPLAASLADTIRGDDEDKRVTAVIAGGRLGLEAIVRQAAATAREPQVSPTFRREVVQAVIRSGGADAGGMLAAFLADADAAVRELAARGLGRLGVAHAAPQLQALAAKEADPVAAHGAADALARLAVPIAAERQAELALRSERRRAEEALLAVETEVLRAMPEAIETVGRYLLDPRSDREVRVLAINMLVSVKDTRIERFLTRAIGDADTIVRRRALGSLGDRFYSVRPLPADVLERVRRIALAESTEPLERAAALRALVSRGGGSAPELERIVRSAHLPARVRLEAARGWAKLAKASALEYEQLFAAVDAEMGPPEEVLVELIHFYGSDAASPDKSWVVRQLDDERPAVGIAARRALHALTQRGVSFTPAEIDALRLRLPRIASEDLRVQLVAFIAGVLEPEEERLAFLRGILSGGSVGEMQAAIAQL